MWGFGFKNVDFFYILPYFKSSIRNLYFINNELHGWHANCLCIEQLIGKILLVENSGSN